MKRLRRVAEPEVIAEFLKNEFYQCEYDRDREEFERFVVNPDLTDEFENGVRRALLFRRRGHMWRELPDDTQWWEVEIEAQDLGRIHVFPRAQWRRISGGSFNLQGVVERIRRRDFAGVPASVLNKIHMLRYRFRSEGPHSTVLLIGVDDRQPLTILEGNHRMAAALLVGPDVAQKRFRIFAGLSSRMAESCWYHTSFGNLWHYAKNRLRNVIDREADVARALAARPQTSAPAATPALAPLQAHKMQETK
jgi:hypothetical protein